MFQSRSRCCEAFFSKTMHSSPAYELMSLCDVQSANTPQQVDAAAPQGMLV
jgi:hypothetical protein